MDDFGYFTKIKLHLFHFFVSIFSWNHNRVNSIIFRKPKLSKSSIKSNYISFCHFLFHRNCLLLSLENIITQRISQSQIRRATRFSTYYDYNKNCSVIALNYIHKYHLLHLLEGVLWWKWGEGMWESWSNEMNVWRYLLDM
jgi:hypothetical protein